MADASGNPADGYYSGRPLAYDPQQAQAVAAPPQAPLANSGTNHTHVHGIPGYYNGRVSNTNTTADPPSASAPPVASSLPVPAVQPERKLSWIDNYLRCFTTGRNAR